MRPTETDTRTRRPTSGAAERGRHAFADRMHDDFNTVFQSSVQNTCNETPRSNHLVADLEVTVGNIGSAEGRILLAIYDSEASFNQSMAYADRAPARKGEIVFSFSNLPVGEYAVMAFHDTNCNGKLDADWVGMPVEPWGASLQGTDVIGAPEWTDVKFRLPKDGLKLTINLHQSQRLFDTLV